MLATSTDDYMAGMDRTIAGPTHSNTVLRCMFGSRHHQGRAAHIGRMCATSDVDKVDNWLHTMWNTAATTGCNDKIEPRTALMLSKVCWTSKQASKQASYPPSTLLMLLVSQGEFKNPCNDVMECGDGEPGLLDNCDKYHRHRWHGWQSSRR